MLSLGQRNAALLNGALIALGALAIVDNLLFHWLLGLHRAVPGPNATAVEIGLVVLGTVLLVIGLWREQRARRGAGPHNRTSWARSRPDFSHV